MADNNNTSKVVGLLRHMAEVASRGIVLRRRLPRHFGRKAMYVSPECGLRYWHRDLGKVDPSLLRMVDRYVQKGDVVWDVGANVGLFGFATAQRAARVVLFEPDPWLARLLEKTAASYNNVSVVRAAVSDYCGSGTLHIAARARASNFLQGNGSTQSGGQRHVETVRVVTLNSLPPPYPNVLKVDVEGAEAAVLRAATRILAEYPTIICEVSSENTAVVTALLGDYALCDGETGRSVSAATWTTVAIPRPRAEKLQAFDRTAC